MRVSGGAPTPARGLGLGYGVLARLGRRVL
jgi:hypothetical protein